MILSSTGRDQNPKRFGPCVANRPASTCSVDFEWGNNGWETGIVQNLLNANTRKPQYCCGNNMSPKSTVHNQTTFDTWFNDSPFTVNVQHNLTLTNTGSNPRIFGFDDQNYFPLDGKGWDVPKGSDEYTALDGNQHNFHFCNEAHGRFAYKGGETFSFLGDDDVFVYINNQLALDLGGVHGPVAGSFSLDSIATSFGLSIGNNYRFDFFWCERHTLGSDIELTTSLEIYCSYYDWCDICDGNGQSCCQTGDCNDQNPCTVDLCAVLEPPSVACQNLQVNCTASDICHTSVCRTSDGTCPQTAVVCRDDGNLCTLERCDVSKGGCIAPQKVCDDGQGVCTTKTCAPSTGVCNYAPVSCDDSNKCTTDSCDTINGCQHVNILCNDNNPCTVDSCSPSTGCVNTPINCDDHNVCTTDSCSAGNCLNIPISCDDHSLCTADSCNPTSGCRHDNVPCSDNNACTSDTCLPNSGCSFTPISCDDSNACTTDTCNSVSGCQHPAVSCSDGNLCTYDTCDAVKGCTFLPKNCDDGLACTVDSCGAGQTQGSSNACVHTLLTCNDNNKCTIDSCSNSTGCVYQPSTCAPSSDPCTTVKCDPTQGCVYTPLDGNVCNACFDTVTNTARHNCTTSDKCHPQLCTIDSNANPVCYFPSNVTCDDQNACTVDSCVSTSGQCVFTTKPCTSSDLCIVASCDPQVGNCTKTAVNCDDGNACTTDSCSGGVCSNVQNNEACLPCGTGSCVTLDYCNPLVCTSSAGAGVCTPTPLVCDDRNLCTDDSCVVHGAWNATCSYVTHNCAATLGASAVDACHPATCDPTAGCSFANVTCNDNNNCTNDACLLTGAGNFTCSNTPRCPTTDPCNPNVCQLGDLTCRNVPVNCDDGNSCTVDSCGVGNSTAFCINTPVLCNFTDLCFPAMCNATLGHCQVSPVSCDDGIVCTIDSCSGGQCSNVLNMCDDFNNCTLDSCSNSANSTDGCVHEPIVCQGNPCINATCDRHLGCVQTPVVCPNNGTNFCLSRTCDETIGCLNVPRTCLLADEDSTWDDQYPDYWKVDVTGKKYKDNDCFTASCDSIKSQCVVVQREPWGSDCAFAYLNQGKKAAILTAGAIAGVAIAAVIFAALAGFGAKKGYDAWVRMKDERMGAASTNPMYAPSTGQGVNALYA